VQGFPAFNKQDIMPFLDAPIPSMPQAAPSIVNAADIKMKVL
jgi:hydroxypyruvate reductase 1